MKREKIFLYCLEDDGEYHARPVWGYVVVLAGFCFGVHRTECGQVWHITEQSTGISCDSVVRVLGYDSPRTLSEAVAVITPRLCEFVANALSNMPEDIVGAALRVISDAYKAEKAKPTTPKDPRPITKLTYNNYMRVFRLIKVKGYTDETAHEITRRLFEDFEQNPHGLPMLSRVAQIVPADAENGERPKTPV